MNFHMFFFIFVCRKSSFTEFTLEGFLTRVNPHMYGQMRTFSTHFITHRTSIFFYRFILPCCLASMYLSMFLQNILTFKSTSTYVTYMRFFITMCISMFSKRAVVIKSFTTLITHVWFITSMYIKVFFKSC